MGGFASSTIRNHLPFTIYYLPTNQTKRGKARHMTSFLGE